MMNEKTNKRNSFPVHRSSFTIHRCISYAATGISPPNCRYVLIGAQANPLSLRGFAKNAVNQTFAPGATVLGNSTFVSIRFTVPSNLKARVSVGGSSPTKLNRLIVRTPAGLPRRCGSVGSEEQQAHDAPVNARRRNPRRHRRRRNRNFGGAPLGQPQIDPRRARWWLAGNRLNDLLRANVRLSPSLFLRDRFSALISSSSSMRRASAWASVYAFRPNWS